MKKESVEFFKLFFIFYLFIYFVWKFFFFRTLSGIFGLFYLLRRSTVEVTGPREGGDDRGSPRTVIIVQVLGF
jgi:hypothetical protein